MLDLAKITLWAAVASEDAEYLSRTIRVLRWCHSFAHWSDIILFSCQPVDGIRQFPMKVIQIPPIPDLPYGKTFQIWHTKVFPAMLLKEMKIRSCGTMHVHEDGFPIEPSLWKPEFMEYDWIGPKWHDDVVGGSAMALRSHAMLHAMLHLPWHDGTNDDAWVCRTHRERLLRDGLQFAPPELASRYCTEAQDNDKPSFGFHHRVLCPDKYKLGWEKIENFEDSIK